MATPTSLPAAVATGDTGTAAQFNGLRGAFRILQVVQASYNVLVGTTVPAFGDTGLTATITPQSTSSLVLVFYSQNIYSNAAGTGANYRLQRNGITLESFSDLVFGAASGSVQQNAFMYLDNPATTSACTYKTQIARNSGVGTIYTAVNSNAGRITLMEVSA